MIREIEKSLESTQTTEKPSNLPGVLPSQDAVHPDQLMDGPILATEAEADFSEIESIDLVNDPKSIAIETLCTLQLFIDNLELPAENLIGEEGKGFKYILDGLNAERILIAAECIGDGYWFVERATKYAKDRVVFDRPIGQNQGVQFPIARSFVNVEAANLMRYKAAALFDAKQPCGAEANMAKLLAADASWEAANACLQTHGGFGFAAEYDVERKFRETRLYQVAPISTNLILSYVGEHILGMPRSF
jgi:acyl-CoA dehydrogenase